MRLAAFGLALFLAPAVALAQGVKMDAPVDVSSVTVAPSAEVRISVVVGGDVNFQTTVVSAPLGINCGGAAFQYTTKENRQCWLWVRRHHPVILTAQVDGRFGQDWTVTWIGCEPTAGGAACTLDPTVETEIGAVFTRLGAGPASAAPAPAKK